MMEGTWVVFVVLLQLVRSSVDPDTQVNSITSLDSTYEPSWVYKCDMNEGCERIKLNETSSSHLTYENVDICRTVCGRFGGLWPRPITSVLSMQTLPIHPKCLRYDLSEVPGEVRPLVATMTQITSANIAAECEGTVTKMAETPVIVYINIKSPSDTLSWHTNEQYMLDLQSRNGNVTVHIAAETVYGARHGLETFTQLIAPTRSEYSDEKECGLRLVAGAKIRDRPVFKHRGFLLDCSRNFFPMTDIKRMINGMAATKMNVFHWHVTDSHSFPLESVRIPQFTRYGAYSPDEIYSAVEVRELIEYAKARGVRVVVEIDAPAHAGNGWQWGQDYGIGDLALCVNSRVWRENCIQPPCGQLNPANRNLYRVLRSLYRDIAEMVTKPALLHMGGDEVLFNCWNHTKEVTDYMTEKGFPTTTDGFLRLWADFHAKALQAWDEESQSAGNSEQQPVMLWSSELTNPRSIQKLLDNTRYVIQVWDPVSSPLLHQIMNKGFRVVSTPKDIWYLDHGFWGATKYSNWRKMYAHVLPRDSKVLGGEVAMWSEYVDTNGLDSRVWPRVAAVAERLWSDVSPAYDVEFRMQRMRARLIARGIRADAISPGWCSQHDSKCL